MLVTDLIDPQELTGFVRELQFPEVAALAAFLPNVQHNATEYAFDRTDRTRRQMAQFRPFDVESPIGARPGMARVRGKVPPISKKMVLMEEEQLLLDALQREMKLSAEMEAEIYNDARNLASDVAARVEYARAQVLLTGKVTFTNDLGFVGAEIDYAVPNANFVAPLGAAWSDHTSGKPVTDTLGWIRDVYMPANANRRPAAMVMNSATALDLQLNAEVRSFLTVTGTTGVALPLLTPEQARAVFASQGLPPVVVIDETVNVPGVGDVSIIPDDTVVFPGAPSTDNFGETFYGTTVEALNLARGGFLSVNTLPGLTGTQMPTYDPEHLWTKVAGLVIPVLKDPNALMVADVS